MDHLLHRTANESNYYAPPPRKSLLRTTTNCYYRKPPDPPTYCLHMCNVNEMAWKKNMFWNGPQGDNTICRRAATNSILRESANDEQNYYHDQVAPNVQVFVLNESTRDENTHCLVIHRIPTWISWKSQDTTNCGSITSVQKAAIKEISTCLLLIIEFNDVSMMSLQTQL